MKQASGLISVIIPTYNRIELLKRAINSVLCQTYTNIELLVVDNCKEVRAEHVIKSYNDNRIKYHFSDIKGPSAARNVGISLASGNYIAFLDDDDEYAPTKFEKQLASIYPQTQFYWTYGAGRIISKNKNTIYRPKYKFFSTFLLGVYCQIAMPSLLFRTECFQKAGRFDDSMFFAEDWDVWFRISKEFRVKATNDIVYVVHYDHEENRLNVNGSNRVVNGIKVFKAKNYSKMNMLQKILFYKRNHKNLNSLEKNPSL